MDKETRARLPIYDAASKGQVTQTDPEPPFQFVTSVRTAVQSTANDAQAAVEAPIKELTDTVDGVRKDVETKVTSTVDTATALLQQPEVLASGGALAGAVMSLPFGSGLRRLVVLPLFAALGGTAAYIQSVGPENFEKELPTGLQGWKAPELELPSFQTPEWLEGLLGDRPAAGGPPAAPAPSPPVAGDMGQATKADTDTYPSRKSDPAGGGDRAE